MLVINENLESNLKKVLYSKELEVIVLDVFKDEVKVYNLDNGLFNLSNSDTAGNYLENIKNTTDDEFIKGLMNLFSVPKLKEELNQKEKIEFKYKTLNNKWYKMTSLIINEDESQKIFAVKESIDNLSNSNGETTNAKYDGLVSRLSDSLLKINNLFSLDDKKINLKNVEEYINSVINNLTSSYPELKKSLNNTFKNVSGRVDDVLLIVDDDAVTRGMIKRIFKDEYKIVELKNGKEALEYISNNSKKGIKEASDNILGIFLDLTMPVLDGFAVLDYLSKNNYLNRIPVVIISGDYEKETKQRVYNYRVADMLEKPFDFEIVKHRISNFINLYRSSNSLNNIINDEERNLKDLINPFVESYLYDYSKNISNVEKYIEILGKKVMEDYPEYELTLDKLEKIKDASKYYDIGFYSVPRSILLKKELSKEDIDKIKSYPLFGNKMLDYVLSLTSDEEYKKYASNITRFYHENYNGLGYPNNLKEDEVPLEASLASICIYYNNLKNKNIDDAFDKVLEKSGVMFNPKLIESFKKIKEEIDSI